MTVVTKQTFFCVCDFLEELEVFVQNKSSENNVSCTLYSALLFGALIECAKVD